MQTFEQIVTLVSRVCKTGSPVSDVQSSPKAIVIDTGDLLDVMQFLQRDPSLYFDMLSCVTGLDNGPGAGMEVIYNLYSIPFDHHVMIRVKIDREAPQIESVTHLWRSANWLEREVFDMYGVIFLHHPDMRRILMPADWDGHPLRKDYKHQEYYRNIKVEY